jgi:hypothetical protein
MLVLVFVMLLLLMLLEQKHLVSAALPRFALTFLLSRITCTDYQSGAIANGCMDDWGVQGGVLLALSIKSGLCVAAPAADTPVTAAPVPAPVAVAPVAAASAPSVTAPKPRDSPVGVSLAASNANASSKQLLLLWVLVSLVLLPL